MEMLPMVRAGEPKYPHDKQDVGLMELRDKAVTGCVILASWTVNHIRQLQLGMETTQAVVASVASHDDDPA
jgi:hypothetical protein